jgi:hypothetical protein
MACVSLSLVSHTNVGKTTLARTLLRRDVGEVLDRPHVTEVARDYTLLETDSGETLRLWDTPGFGDSARLLKRLRQSANPVGWLLAQVWDRYTDRPFFSSQQAVRNVRDAADVVLYLVNAAEDPAGAGYVAPEMEILGWTGKPVLVLLNQLGAPRPQAEERLDVDRWAGALARYACVRDTIAFDAFARCWVQEHTLLERIGTVVADDKRPAFERIVSAWRERNERVFEQSIAVLARELATIALDGEPVPTPGLGAAARAWLRNLIIDRTAESGLDTAMKSLAQRADQGIRQATGELIELHGLSGKAAEDVQARMTADFSVDLAADTGRAGVIGAAVSGALGGLVADLATGGLSLGAGALLGAIVGAAGGAGFAHGYNLLRGTERSTVRWGEHVLTGLVRAAALRYLAVAHYGRGRGDFVASEYPAHWQPVVQSAVAAEDVALASIWASAADGSDAASIAGGLRQALERILRGTLRELYP